MHCYTNVILTLSWMARLTSTELKSNISTAQIEPKAAAQIDKRPENYANVTDAIIGHVFKSYRKHQRPSNDGKQATEVVVYLSILSITKVDVMNMEYTADMYLRQKWVDPRLAWDKLPGFNWFEKSIAIPSKKTELWLPDLFFRNGKEGYLHDMTTPNYLLRLEPNGEILYSQKITMRFACQMELQSFPMDTQKCTMNIGSYGYTTDDLVFVWHRFIDPVSINNKTEVNEFNLSDKFYNEDCTQNTKTGSYTCLQTVFFLKRQLGSYLATTYIPSVLIIMVSWLNFWVSVEAVPGRVSLGLLTLLGILSQGTSLIGNLPRVSYIKAIDIWMIFCTIFVIGALIEFAFASFHARSCKRETWKNEIKHIVRQELQRVMWDLSPQPGISHRNSPHAQLSRSYMAPNRAQSVTGCAHQSAQAVMECRSCGGGNEVRVNSGDVGKRRANSSVNAELGMPIPALVNVNPMLLSPNAAQQQTQQPSNAYTEELEELLTNAVDKGTKASGLRPPNAQSASSTGSDIDAYSRFLFPACFLLCNCFYWLYYLVIANRVADN